MTTQPWLKIYEELGVSTPLNEGRSLASYVQEHVQLSPDTPAVEYFGKILSYAQLNSQANKLANALHNQGIGYSDVVGIHLPNTPQYIIALIAISKLGATGTGISPILAPGEVAHQIEDAKVKVLLSLSDLAPALESIPSIPSCLKRVVSCGPRDFLDAPAVALPNLENAPSSIDTGDYLSFVKDQSDTFDAVAIDPKSTFMIQYTGGTTGAPKGAELSHEALIYDSLISSATHHREMDYQMVLATAFPIFHVAGLTNIISSLINGALYLAFANPRDTDHICDTLKRIPPSHLAAVPALYEMLLANPKFKEVDFSGLIVALTGAAPVTKSTVSALNDVIGKNKISDAFGMTETGPTYILHPNTRYKMGSIGIPVIGSDVRIVDIETGKITQKIGEPGEIITSGPHVMTAYLGRPDATADSLREIDGKRWMFSGDVGYMDEDGYIFLCDRAKDMLIVGGYKVFSVEVEDKLCSMPEIASCAIIGTADERRPGNDIVHLFIELAADFKDTSQDDLSESIMTYCRENMAAYKIPKQLHFIDEIPLTPIGKINKKVMRATLS